MPVINDTTRDAWQSLANKLALDRPSVGKRVQVQRGKRKGKQGIVTRHMLDKFSRAYRYGGDASHHFKDMAGRAGWCCLVDTGTETFWTKADNVTIL